MSVRCRLLTSVVAGLLGCGQLPDTEQIPTAATRPSSQAARPSTQPATASVAATQAVDDEPARLVVRIPGRRQHGWLLIGSPANPDKEAYAEARLADPSHLVIETRNVERLVLELAQLKNRSPDRLILRIDNQGIEITGAGGLSVRLLRGKTGAWNVVH